VGQRPEDKPASVRLELPDDDLETAAVEAGENEGMTVAPPEDTISPKAAQLAKRLGVEAGKDLNGLMLNCGDGNSYDIFSLVEGVLDALDSALTELTAFNEKYEAGFKTEKS